MLEYTLGIIVVCVVLETTRRALGWALPLVAAAALAFAYFGRYLPYPFTHRGYSIDRLLANQYLTHEGLFGSMLGIATNLIAIFVLFGCLMQFVGVGNLFMALSMRIAGKSAGGPAKLAVLASTMFGSISGSSTSNVVATGTTTIPLIKKSGFSATFAGAVEAVASTGSQLLPPVMGVAAFLMATVTGIGYVEIMVAAIVPGLLYYASIFFVVDLEARRLNIRGNLDPNREGLGSELKRSYLLLPIGILVFLLLQNFSPAKSVFFSILGLLVLSIPSWRSLLKWPELADFLKTFSAAIVTVGLACATAGIIIGALNITGATFRLSYVIIELAGDSRILLLIGTMLLTVLLGCGLPTPAAYAVAAAFAAPTLEQAGFGKLQAHMFIFYYACLSSITPPVAIAAFAAAGIAGSNPMRTGLMASKLALGGFLIPFMFAWNPAFFIGYADTWQVVGATAGGLIGVGLMAVATVGHLGRRVSVVERLGYFIAAIALLEPSLIGDLTGLGIAALLLAFNHWRRKIGSAVDARPA